MVLTKRNAASGDKNGSRPTLVFEMAKQVELSIRCVFKGYHECPFEVNIGEKFYAFKKRGKRGIAFKVTNDRGQLSHLRIEVVSPRWHLHKKITM